MFTFHAVILYKAVAGAIVTSATVVFTDDHEASVG